MDDDGEEDDGIDEDDQEEDEEDEEELDEVEVDEQVNSGTVTPAVLSESGPPTPGPSTAPTPLVQIVTDPLRPPKSGKALNFKKKSKTESLVSKTNSSTVSLPKWVMGSPGLTGLDRM